MDILKKINRLLPLSLVVLAFFGCGPGNVMASGIEALRTLPVQDAGRLKPLDSFARETLQLVHGRRSYKKLSAVEVVLTWMLAPNHWNDQKFVVIDRRSIKEDLKLDPKTKYFSPDEILASDRLSLAFAKLQEKRASGEKLTPHFQDIQQLQAQLNTFKALQHGYGINVLPPKEGDTWIPVAELPEGLAAEFEKISRAFVGVVALHLPEKAPTGDQETASEDLASAVASFQEKARQHNPELYPAATPMNIEVHYNQLHPFMWTWILYLLAAILMGFAWSGQRRWAKIGAWSVLVLGFLMHTYGFGLRVYLTGRPPVSNMYETVIWVSWGTILFAMIIEAIYKRKHIFLAGALVGVLCLIVADLSPTVLDPTLQPLEPVLRSNFWLTVHVLTITISYAAFFLAFGLGDVGLYHIIFRSSDLNKKLKSLSDSIYRALQIGVVLLAPGIILGGVWADYSWGRFWGWDPKETWSLIALLGYLAILHGRIGGFLKSFGMIVSSVIGFSLILMSWYGVNFVLGAGLHSYGFGAGGVEYVTGFVVAHFILVAIAFWRYQPSQKVKSTQKSPK